MTRCCIMMLAISLLASSQLVADDVSSLASIIQSIGKEGKGNEAAAKAVAELSKKPVVSVPDILKRFDGASPLAVNYLRSAVESIVDRHLKQQAKTKSPHQLPVEKIEELVRNQEYDPRARRLGFEVVARVDSSAFERLIPEMLRDPSPEFRRDAVQRLVDLGGQAKGVESVVLFKQALSGATDADQVKAISKSLKNLKVDVDLQAHFGFLTKWQVIGPFDNVDLVGFAKSYAPEEKLDLKTKLEGQKGEVAWNEISTADEFGIIDIAKLVAPHKGAVMYLTTTFDSDVKRDLQLRLGTPNAWKIWVNGEHLFGRDEYHRGMAIDQYTVDAKFKAGKNTILLKLCQNEQTQDWAQRYQIQIRVCDASGIAVISKGKSVAANISTGSNLTPTIANRAVANAGSTAKGITRKESN